MVPGSIRKLHSYRAVSVSGTRVINNFHLPKFSAFADHLNANTVSSPSSTIRTRSSVSIPLPHHTIPEPEGQDLYFINVAHSHVIHTDWAKLKSLSSALNPFRNKHILLKIRGDPIVSLEFFEWVEHHRPDSLTLEIHSIILHVLTKAKRFKIAESHLKKILSSKAIRLPSELFDSILYSYRLCDSSPRVFDSLFKTYAHMKKFRNATETFCRMRDYGFLPTTESCNAYMSSLLDMHRTDIVLAFYREMGRRRISPNVYTLNMVIAALCKSGKLEKAVEVLRAMESMGCVPTVTSYNTLIAGYCNQDLMNSAMKLRTEMSKMGLHPNVVTYNTLINGFCKKGRMHEANKAFSQMKSMHVDPNTVTYNTLINGYSLLDNSEMGGRLYEEMQRDGVKVDILTYNALILGLCKEGKTRKASYLVKELDKANLTPNASIFSNLISGQCKRQNCERAFELYKKMKKSGFNPNADTFRMIISTFCKNKDFDGATQVLMEMYGGSIAPDEAILLDVFEGLCGSEKVAVASMLWKDLERKHFLPEGFSMDRFFSVA